MSLASELTSTTSWEDVPLDPSLLSLRMDEAMFFKAQTGIINDDELKQHIITVQAEAFKVAPYPCIRRFGFTRLKISRHPRYDDVLRLGKGRENALLLDLACCVGNDARKAVADGWPEESVIASDLHAEFWSVGHSLFRSTPTSCTIRFIPGDLFSDAFLAPSSDTTRAAEAGTLNPFRSKFTAIHVAAFFHLFSLPTQRDAAARISCLLSIEPGSIIFGSNIGADEAGTSLGRLPYLHNSASWVELWAFDSGLRVTAELRTIDGYLGQGVAARSRSGNETASGFTMKLECRACNSAPKLIVVLCVCILECCTIENGPSILSKL